MGNIVDVLEQQGKQQATVDSLLETIATEFKQGKIVDAIASAEQLVMELEGMADA